ncbi:MAG TPA: cupin domain-containing protein [Blastocatellia bacterium]|nr:cupin domain-containing protein [Blastocatellia bacterium]
MSRRNLCRLVLVGFALALMVGSASAISTFFSVQGRIDSFSFPAFPGFPGFDGPANTEMVGLTLKPGDVIPWHYHQGPAYVIVSRGTLTEDDGCGQVRQFRAGSAFGEEPGHVHQVSNQGHGVVVLYFAAVYPANSEDAIFVDGPNCP